VRKLEEEHRPIPVANLAASFQAAVVDVLYNKTMRAAEEYGVKEIVVAGGVSANRALREAFKTRSPLPVNIPTLSLCTDNGAMIGSAGYFHYLSGHFDPLNLDVLPTWPLS
jgi:N6-L-threonylcarbamoyladenine synthase